jgi:hypothetical protein
MKGKKKGAPKTGGRVAGVPNKRTVEALNRAEKILQLIESNYIEDDITNLSPGQRMDLYQNLLEYTMPKLSRTDLSGNIKQKLEIEIIRRKAGTDNAE